MKYKQPRFADPNNGTFSVTKFSGFSAVWLIAFVVIAGTLKNTDWVGIVGVVGVLAGQIGIGMAKSHSDKKNVKT